MFAAPAHRRRHCSSARAARQLSGVDYGPVSLVAKRGSMRAMHLDRIAIWLRDRWTRCALVCLSLVVACTASRATHATLALPVQSASAAGAAGAGAEAAADDASTVYYNPAAMVLLSRREI